MYAGHFAAGLVLKSEEPRIPTWILLTGTGLLDVLFGIFVPLGHRTRHHGAGFFAGIRLDYIDWSHSLVMSLLWAAGVWSIVSEKRMAYRCIRRDRGVLSFSSGRADASGGFAVWPEQSYISEWTCGTGFRRAGGGSNWDSWFFVARTIFGSRAGASCTGDTPHGPAW